MSISDPHVLPADVILAPVHELEVDVRERLQARPDDFALTRAAARASTKIIDGSSARMLQLFRTPRRIVDAILEFSETERLDPEPTLRDAFPMLSHLIDAGILVEEGSGDERPIAAEFPPGTRIGSWEVLTCVQSLNDVELYQVRDDDARVAALKIARTGSAWTRDMLAREAMVLSRLDGVGAPSLIADGDYQSRPYLAIEWRAGVDAAAAAGEIRALGPPGRARLLDLCCAIADAYAGLHRRGVVHGDVHERNLLVDASGAVCVLDFGLARVVDDATNLAPRGGVGTYYEPEYARASCEGRRPPPVSEIAEQYSVAALVYYLYCGAHYVDFALERDEALRQTALEPPLSFVSRAVEPFPELEHVLATAMSKDPAGRYATTAEFAQRLHALAASIATGAARTAAADGVDDCRALVDATLAILDPQAETFAHHLLPPPTCSVNFGSAGIACALYRMAMIRDDAGLLARADAWSSRANANLETDAAFNAPALDLALDDVGSISLYHSPTGVHLVTALIANAMGDFATLQGAVDAFVASSDRPCENPDLTLGRSGILLGCALLLEAVPRSPHVTTTAVRRLGARYEREIATQVADFPEVRDTAPFLNLGVAHGWAGVLYASLRWSALARRRPALRVRRRLGQLAACGEPFGRGLRWPWREPGSHTAERGYMAGWCNGSAGFVHLWLQAHATLGDTEWERLATAAAWSTWDAGEEDNIDLCCGHAGRAYALLALFRHTGDRQWLDRATRLAQIAAMTARSSGSELTCLYKSGLGTALLAAELDRPEAARMPLFEHEGWPADR